MPASQHQSPKSDIEISQSATKRRILDVAKEKLGIAAENLDPYGHFMAKVTSCSKDQRSDGTTTERVELQIEALCIESEDEENEEADEEEKKPSKRRSLYGAG